MAHPAVGRDVPRRRAQGERVRFEDIPHSTFSVVGKKAVRGSGSRAEEVIYNQPENPDDMAHLDVNPGYIGAAGGTSRQAAMSEGFHDRKTVLEMDEQELDALYSGFGVRSKHALDPNNITNRTTSKQTDADVWGNINVVGSDVRLDKAGMRDPRDFGGAAAAG